MEFSNAYQDVECAESYAKLEFPATYYLAYRDLPEIFATHAKGKKALDFGCGAGRSTRFLKQHGFYAKGVDIADSMLKMARQFDVDGDYLLVKDGDLSLLEKGTYDLVLSAFAFDNIPNVDHRINILSQIADLLNNKGIMVLLGCTPEIYTNEWASFSTKDFPENQYAHSGEKVKIVGLDVEDKRPVEDIIWFDEDYRDSFAKAGLEIVQTYKPLAKQDEPYNWVNETSIAPWVIYVLKKG